MARPRSVNYPGILPTAWIVYLVLWTGLVTVFLAAEFYRASWPTRAVLLVLIFLGALAVDKGVKRIPPHRRGPWLPAIPIVGAVIAFGSPTLGVPMVGYAYFAVMAGVAWPAVARGLRRGRSYGSRP